LLDPQKVDDALEVLNNRNIGDENSPPPSPLARAPPRQEAQEGRSSAVIGDWAAKEEVSKKKKKGRENVPGGALGLVIIEASGRASVVNLTLETCMHDTRRAVAFPLSHCGHMATTTISLNYLVIYFHYFGLYRIYGTQSFNTNF
jgi:hypothetical protein